MNEETTEAIVPAAIAPARTVQRVRHAVKLRRAEVRRVVAVTPSLLRVTFSGDDLRDFVSASYDDHVKLFFAAPGQTEPVLPLVLARPSGDAVVAAADAAAPKPIGRDYTPRRFDPAAGELDIEFVLHGDGPASNWAAQARAGQQLVIGGPRGSFVVPADFDWHLLIGDETALPAIARRLEELPAGPRVFVFVEVAGASEQPLLASDAHLQVTWLHRCGAEPGRAGLLLRALSTLARPAGDGFVWAGGEASEIAAIRRHLVERWQLDKRRIRASAYWKLGAVAHHETFEDTATA